MGLPGCGGTEKGPVANPTPTNATDPTYRWDDGSAGITATYSWDAPGSYTIAVTGSTACGLVTATQAIVVCGPLDGVAITGPATLEAGEEGLFFAAPEPPPTTRRDPWDASICTSYCLFPSHPL